MPPRAATLTHGAVWGTAQVTLPGLGIAPPAIFWAPQDIAIDALHHTVYALATGIAYELLSNGRVVRRLRRLFHSPTVTFEPTVET